MTLFKKRVSAALAMLMTVLTVSTATAAERPDAGKALEGVKGREITVPEKSAAPIKVLRPDRPPLTKIDGPKILINGFCITGQTIYDERELLALIADAQGKEHSLSDLESLAARITNYFQKNGYLVARAYIPAQEIKGGVLEIAVIVGKYGKIDIVNKSAVPTARLSDKLATVKAGEVIEKRILERSLLLLDDVPGVAARASLSPGKAVGTSDLTVELAGEKAVTGNFTMDNYGNRYTGRVRFSTDIHVNNLRGNGDKLFIKGLVSDENLDNGYMLYAFPTDNLGGQLSVGYTHMFYELGRDFSPLEAYGDARVRTVTWTYPLERSPESNLYFNISYEDKKLQDRINSFSSIADKKSNGIILGLTGNKYTTDGADSYSVSYTAGTLDILSADDLALDQATTQANGEFKKWNLNYVRQQYINNRTMLLLYLTGQTSNRNLDSSEKISLGGINGVRAYPQGEASGDQGYLFSGEFRWTLSRPQAEKTVQFVSYFDAGTVMLNKKAYTGAGDNRRTLAGMGVGLIYGQPKDFMLRLDYAWRTNNEVETSEAERNGRFWLQTCKYF